MSIAAENSTEIIAVKEKKNSNQTIFFMFKNTLKLPDLLKISQIILSCPLADCFEFRAFLARRCLCSQNISKYQKILPNDSKILRRSGYFCNNFDPQNF